MRIYNQEDLADALDQALDVNDSAEAFVAKFLANAAKLINKTPKYYRYFGPYWWPLKKLMLDANIGGIDDFIDAEWLEKAWLDSPELICVAAFCFQETLLQNKSMASNSYLLEDSEGNAIEFVLYDNFLEAKIRTG